MTTKPTQGATAEFADSRNRITNGIGQDWMKAAIAELEQFTELTALEESKQLYDLMLLRANEAALAKEENVEGKL